MTNPENVTITLTDREANIIRRAIALYASTGADGCTTECWNIHRNIINAQLATSNEDGE